MPAGRPGSNPMEPLANGPIPWSLSRPYSMSPGSRPGALLCPRRFDTATGLPLTPNGGDVNVTFNASGIFKV
jgi:hypothetical protein